MMGHQDGGRRAGTTTYFLPMQALGCGTARMWFGTRSFVCSNHLRIVLCAYEVVVSTGQPNGRYVYTLGRWMNHRPLARSLTTGS